eukprot:scaffold1397_cov254-Pinguiococcus_pyrenoidosus.AAC.4
MAWGRDAMRTFTAFESEVVPERYATVEKSPSGYRRLRLHLLIHLWILHGSVDFDSGVLLISRWISPETQEM